MEVVRTLQVAKQLDMMGGTSLGNLAGALTNLSGGNGGMSSGMSNSMGSNMMGSAGGMGPSTMGGAGTMGPGTMGAGPMGGTAMGGSSMSGASMSAPMGSTMSSSMGGMSGGPPMSEYGNNLFYINLSNCCAQKVFRIATTIFLFSRNCQVWKNENQVPILPPRRSPSHKSSTRFSFFKQDDSVKLGKFIVQNLLLSQFVFM